MIRFQYLLLLVFALTATSLFGQEHISNSSSKTSVKSNSSKASAVVDLEKSAATISTKVGGKGTVDISVQKGENTTSLGFNVGASTRATIQLIRDGIVVHSYQDRSGPDGELSIFSQKEVVAEYDHMGEEEAWWPLVLLAVACCLEVEVSHTSNSDGTSSTTTTVGLDCDCLSVELKSAGSNGTVPVKVNGEQYDITAINIIPILTGENSTFPKTGTEISVK